MAYRIEEVDIIGLDGSHASLVMKKAWE